MFLSVSMGIRLVSVCYDREQCIRWLLHHSCWGHHCCATENVGSASLDLSNHFWCKSNDLHHNQNVWCYIFNYLFNFSPKLDIFILTNWLCYMVQFFGLSSSQINKTVKHFWTFFWSFLFALFRYAWALPIFLQNCFSFACWL